MSNSASTEATTTGPRLTLEELARHLAGRRLTDGVEGVSTTDISRDLLKILHPDVARDAVSIPVEAAATFRSVTEAQQYSDDVTIQGLYATTIAEAGLNNSSDSSVSHLERTRYKAWLALQAGKGKFDSKEEVDTWKERMLATAPYTVRAQLMASTFNIFTEILGTANGTITLPDETTHHAISQGLEASKQAFAKIMDDDTPTEEIVRARTRKFDEALGDITTVLASLKLSESRLGASLGQNRALLIRSFGNLLQQAARALEGRLEMEDLQKFGSLITQLVLGEGLEPRRTSILDSTVLPPKYTHPTPSNYKEKYFEESQQLHNNQKKYYDDY
jgi:hypothetical protein